MPAGSPSVMAILGGFKVQGSGFSVSPFPFQLQLPHPPLPQPPLPQPDGLSQPPSLPQPPCATPFAFGSSYRRQHFSRPQSPESFDGFRLRSCCFAILIDTGSNEVRNVVQHNGRPHVP